jgi:hypothetical protein
LQEGVASTRVILFGPVSAAYVILYFHLTHGLAQSLGGTCSEPWGAKPPEDMVRWEANCALNEKMKAQKGKPKAPPPVGERAVGGYAHRIRVLK